MKFGVVTPEVVVVGHIGRDLVVLVDRAPGPGESLGVHERREMLGGKGANQALALTQLGHHVAVVGAVGDDDTGGWALDSAAEDGIDIQAVSVRPATSTGLIVSIVDAEANWRYLEDIPDATLVRPGDVEQAGPLFGSCRVASLQLQEPFDSVVLAAELARQAGATVVLDGAPPRDADADRLFACADVLRADSREAAILTGGPVENADQAMAAGRTLAGRGPGVVVLAVGEEGNAVIWDGGQALVPLTGGPVVDQTGGGDAMVAGLIAGLLRHPDDPLLATCVGTAAAGTVVRRLGGRPEINSRQVWESARTMKQAVTAT